MTEASTNRETIEKWFNRQGLALFVDWQLEQRSIRVGQGLVGIAWVIEVLVVALLAPRQPLLSTAHWQAVGIAVVVLAVSLLAPVLFVPRLPAPLSAALLLVTFVVGPVVTPLVFGQPVLATAMAGVNLALLLFSYLLVGGVIALTQWAIDEIRRQMLQLVGVLARTLPFLFIGIAILFLTSEVWQLAANIRWQLLLVTLGVFLALGTLCLVTRLVAEVRDCCAAAEGMDLAAAASSVRTMSGGGAFSSLDGVDLQHQRPAPAPAALEKINIGLLLLFAQSLQIVGVSVALGAIFLVFGLLAIPPETVASFLPEGRSVRPVPYLPELTMWGQQIVVTQELLTVTAIIAVFSYLSFVFFAVTREDYATEFLKHVHARINEALALRRIYRTTLWAPRRERLQRGRRYRLSFEVPPAFHASNAVLLGGPAGTPPTAHEMRRFAGGFRHQEVLSAGEGYRYRFVVDGVPHQDAGADEYVRDDDGVMFSVVVLPGR